MYRFIVTIVAVLLSFEACAITLEEALVSAYNNNDDLKTYRRDFLISIEQFPQALSEFMPRVEARFDSTKSKQKGKSQFGSGAPSTETNVFEKSITLTQPVFNGGRSVAALKAAQSAFRSARAQYYLKEQNTFLSAIEAYVDCYVTKERLDIADTSIKSNQKQLEAMQEKLNVGESTQTELASARAALSMAETKKLTAYANFQSAKANFTKIFGIEPLDITLPEIPTNLPLTFEEFISKSMKTNQEIENAKHETSTTKANENVAKAALLPEVNFQVKGGRTYYDPETQGTSQTNSSGVSSVLSVTIPIIPEGGAVYSKVRKAKLATRNSAINLEAKVKKVNADCITYWESFNTAKYSITSSSTGVESAQIAYDGSIQEELVGTKTILDVLISEERLNETKLAKVEATKKYILAAYQMKTLMGQLTAKSLHLKVNYFEPEQEFKNTKMKIIGF